jgi:FPC/CPF motif-containing protein YcgG
LVLWQQGGHPAPPLAQFVHGQVRALVLDPRFPCLGARSAVNRGSYRFSLCPALASSAATAVLSRDLSAFVAEQPSLGADFTTYIASFAGPVPDSEKHFERLLWRQLQRLSDRDTAAWDPAVSADPDDPHFSFSFAGRAFFVVGLHPRSSRWARIFAWPTLVFNAHYQFESLRVSGKFGRLQSLIRGRDIALQGSANPNLEDFGAVTEARQYSGRAVEEGWRCPFQHVPHANPCPSERVEAGSTSLGHGELAEIGEG